MNDGQKIHEIEIAFLRFVKFENTCHFFMK